MARKIGNTKRQGYAVSKKKQNKIIPFLGAGVMFFIGMLAGKLEVMTFTGPIAFASFVPQLLGRVLYFVVVFWLWLPGIFAFDLMPYFEWNRLVLIGASSVIWGLLLWVVSSLGRR